MTPSASLRCLHETLRASASVCIVVFQHVAGVDILCLLMIVMVHFSPDLFPCVPSARSSLIAFAFFWRELTTCL
jgi:hypothetical protein